MLKRTLGAAVQGIDAIKVEIEVSVEPGTGFVLVGLPDTAVKESAERVRCAIQQTGADFPMRNVVINMSPADVKKEGSAYDLPLAVGIMAADGLLADDLLGRYMLMGELSLDGSLRPIRGALPMAIVARELGLDGFIKTPSRPPWSTTWTSSGPTRCSRWWPSSTATQAPFRSLGSTHAPSLHAHKAPSTTISPT